MIKLTNITKSYHCKNRTVLALSNIDIGIQKGEMVILTGPSGSGKTTLINIIGTLLRQTSGEYYFKNKLLPKTEDGLSAYRSSNIGFILQDYSLIPGKTIYDNISLPLVLRKTSKKDMNSRVLKVADQLGISDKLTRFPHDLSGGECQRAAIARAFISEPSILLADEPTSSLDEKNKNSICEIFRDLNAEGITIVIATHDKDVINSGSRVVTLEQGKITNDNVSGI